MLILRKNEKRGPRKLEVISSIFFYKKIQNALPFILFILFFALLSSCKKQDDAITYSPDGDVLSVDFSDTSSIVAYTVKQDSLLTYNILSTKNASVFLAGNYVDPIFGYASAGFYAQLSLPTTNVNFGSNLHLDSVVLSLDYENFYGIDTLSNYTIHVHELTESLSTDSTYYSNSNHAIDNTPIGTKTFIPDFSSDVFLKNGDTLSPQLRIRLNDSFGQRLLDLSGQAELVDDESFVAFLKGIYLTFSDQATNPNEGLLFAFNLLNENSKLTLYYSNIDNDSLSYSFPFSMTEHVIHSVFLHDYSGSEVETALVDTTSGMNQVYIQSMAGTKTAISFPFIKDWSTNNNVAINKAELILTVEGGTYDVLSPHPKLQLLVDSAGSTVSIPDEAFTNGYAVDGAYNETDHTYTFNISLYIQDILSEEASLDDPLYLVAYSAYENAYRSVLAGYQHPTSSMKLKLTYTKL